MLRQGRARPAVTIAKTPGEKPSAQDRIGHGGDPIAARMASSLLPGSGAADLVAGLRLRSEPTDEMGLEEAASAWGDHPADGDTKDDRAGLPPSARP
jgi:hypothetical protein